jgi:lipopolysaccharide transport system permease protein/teichoic acid transport system permease protein
MAKQDLAQRYVGTAGGILWAFVHPALMVLIYWFVFSIGFKAQAPGHMPFVLYFVSGLVPWLLFSEVLLTSMTAVTTNAALIKKTVFPSEILPVAHFLSASFTHLVFIALLCALCLLYGYGPRLTLLQVGYYYIALGCLSLGLSWMVGSIHVFHRDLAQAVSALLNLWFWVTPVVWPAEMIPRDFTFILRFNPVYYIVDGYRSVITGIPFWSRLSEGVIFWAVTAPVLLAGAYVFKRLKPEFAEVL